MITDPKKLIIRRPGAQSTKGKIISWLLSVGFWWPLLHLFRVSLAVMGWGTAWGISHSIAGRMHTVTVLHAAMIIYLPEIMGLSLLLWGWALYNWMRFHGVRDKRCEPLPPLSSEEVSRALSLSQSLLEQAREAKVDVCHFDDGGCIENIDCYASVDEAKQASHQLPLSDQHTEADQHRSGV